MWLCASSNSSCPAAELGRMRWCSGCAKANHHGARDMRHKMCDDCGMKVCHVYTSSCGLLCVTAQAMEITPWTHCLPLCVQAPSFGLQGDKRRRWCVQCARSSHPNSVDVISKKCEDCGEPITWTPPQSCV